LDAEHDPAALLGRTALFGSLELDDLRELAKVTRLRTFLQGELIFSKDDPGYTLYVIATGSVKISFSSREGEEIILTILTGGEFFGELALFDGKTRSADAEATADSAILTLQRDDLLPLLTQRPGVTAQLLKVLSQRIRSTDEALGDATFLNIASRLAKKLLELGEEHGQVTPRGTRISLTLTQQDLASMIGARRENVNRALAHARKHGWLSDRNGVFTILNKEALRIRSIY
jgi:CRP/FNR family cyclic AMP-dependent transcriptional regulator